MYSNLELGTLQIKNEESYISRFTAKFDYWFYLATSSRVKEAAIIFQGIKIWQLDSI